MPLSGALVARCLQIRQTLSWCRSFSPIDPSYYSGFFSIFTVFQVFPRVNKSSSSLLGANGSMNSTRVLLLQNNLHPGSYQGGGGRSGNQWQRGPLMAFFFWNIPSRNLNRRMRRSTVVTGPHRNSNKQSLVSLIPEFFELYLCCAYCTSYTYRHCTHINCTNGILLLLMVIERTGILLAGAVFLGPV